MGTRTGQVIATAGYQRSLITLDIGGLTLKAAYLYELSDAGLPLDCWAQIGIMSGGTTLHNRVALLDQGYAGIGTGVAWTGTLAFPINTFLYATVYAREASTYRLAAITADNIPNP